MYVRRHLNEYRTTLAITKLQHMLQSGKAWSFSSINSGDYSIWAEGRSSGYCSLQMHFVIRHSERVWLCSHRESAHQSRWRMQIRLREKRLFRSGQLFLPLLHFLVLKCFHGFIFFLLLQSKLSAMHQEGKSMETELHFGIIPSKPVPQQQSSLFIHKFFNKDMKVHANANFCARL